MLVFQWPAQPLLLLMRRKHGGRGDTDARDRDLGSGCGKPALVALLSSGFSVFETFSENLCVARDVSGGARIRCMAPSLAGRTPALLSISADHAHSKGSLSLALLPAFAPRVF